MNDNLSNFARRLGAVMKERKLNQQELADACGVSRAAVALWMAGKSEPNSGKIIKAAEKLRVSPNFLLFGGENHLPQLREYIRIKKYVAPASSGPGELESQETAEIEQLDVSPMYFQQYISASKAEHLSIVPARGDSMQPTWNDGDMLIINELENYISRDGCYVFYFDGSMYAKRVSIRPTGLLVISDNAKYPPFEIEKDMMQLLHVAGRVIQVYSRAVMY